MLLWIFGGYLYKKKLVKIFFIKKIGMSKNSLHLADLIFL